MKVEHLVRRNYQIASPYRGIDSIRKQLLDCYAMVVQDDEEFYGVITLHDIGHSAKILIIDCLIEKPIIDIEVSIDKAISIMNADHTTVLPVSQNGKIIGLVFKSDLLNFVLDYNTDLQNEIKLRTFELEKVVATKNLLYSIIAHDLRSPFNSILVLSNLLCKNVHKYDLEKTEEYLNIINSQANNAYRLLDDLLVWSSSQIEQLAFNPILLNLAITVQEVVNLLEDSSKKKGIKIQSMLAAEVVAYVDKSMIESVLRNVIANAIKFTHSEGEIIIRSKSDKNFVEISIEDNGIGISDIEKTLIFNSEFYKTKQGTANEKGTGLGLKICKTFINNNGGDIWVDSNTPVGSVFKFTLPKYIGQDKVNK